MPDKNGHEQLPGSVPPRKPNVCSCSFRTVKKDGRLQMERVPDAACTGTH